VRVLLDDERHGHTEHYFNARLDAPGRPGTVVEATVLSTASTGLLAKERIPLERVARS